MARRSKGTAGDDAHQLQIDWSPEPMATMPAATAAGMPSSTAIATSEPLVQRLPWDFKTSFPLPSDEAIDNGVLDESDRQPENLKSLHENYARQCLATLAALDKLMDARRRGIDPGTGNKPRTHASRERLRKYLTEEPARLEHTFHILIETYENAFGVDAAAAFAKCIRARYAGIPVEVEGRPDKVNANADAEEQPVEQEKPQAAGPPTRRSRISTVLPVPNPLPEAVAAGHFGEEDGKPINPTPAEVRAITENHAEKIIDLLDGLRVAERQLIECSDIARVGAECNRLKEQVKSAIEKYAASFGPEAGQRLEAHVRHEARKDAGRRR